MNILPQSFYEREVLDVAPQLLGKVLVRLEPDSSQIRGVIYETEAYRGMEDQACHARVGKTKRTEVMFGSAGKAYVYFTYGMHWMLNCVCGPEGYPAAVLIRAILVIKGLELVSQRRANVKPALWTNGPAKLTQALNIDQSLNGVSLYAKEPGLWIEEGQPIEESWLKFKPRVGIFTTPEPWFSKLWNFQIDAAQLKT